MEPGLNAPSSGGASRTGVRPPAPWGFTLIELTFVLLLLAILSAFSIPRFFVITEINLRTSARNLAQTLLQVSAMATNFSTPYVVQYDMDKNRTCFKQADYNAGSGAWSVVFPDDPDREVVADPNARTRCVSLKDGVYFKEVRSLSGTERTYEKGSLPAWFSPRGLTDPMVIVLGDRKGRFYTLFVPRYGGRVTVRSGRLEYREYLREILE